MAKDLALNVVMFIWGFVLGYVLMAYIANKRAAAHRLAEKSWAETFRPIRPIDSVDEIGSTTHNRVADAILKNERILGDYFKGLR